jgi:uncharacterized membrane protein
MSDAQPPPPPMPAPPSAPMGEDKTMPMVVYGLYLAGIVTAGLTTIIGFIIALASRATATPMLETHYRFQVRTGLAVVAGSALGLVMAIVSVPLMFILIGFLVLKLAFVVWALTGLYLIVRAVVGLMRLSNGEPYPNPDSWTL